jgi:hypothetical protein
MNRTIRTSFLRLLASGLLFLFTAAGTQADEKDVFDRIVRITNRKGTIYELLEDISGQSGYVFAYDSRIIDSNKRVRVSKGEYTLRHAIYLITGNKQLKIDLLGEHILLRLSDGQPQTPEIKKEPLPDPFFTLEGTLSDRETGRPVPFASVGILNSTTGTISNQDGAFRLTIPDSLAHHNVRFSHIGYESTDVEPEWLKGKRIDLALKPQFIPLREVVVKYVNPMQLLNRMLNQRPVNYSSEPVYLTSFYREGIEYRRKNIDLTESVLRIYKTGYDQPAVNDQVKLIKKRRFVNLQQADTIFPKMKSGINSCLILDIMKELPEFINPDSESSYIYTNRGVDRIDGRMVNIIGFRQKDQVREPLYRGDLYIEKDSKALIEIRFEINPLLAGKATHMFVDKKSAGLKMDLRHARYIVSYKPSEAGIYYINHVRGEIEFKIHRRRRLFGSPLNFRFEMVTCKVDTHNVQPLPRNERLSPARIFAETRHGYDKDFWESFNIILPEEALKEEIIRNLREVTVTDNN